MSILFFVHEVAKNKTQLSDWTTTIILTLHYYISSDVQCSESDFADYAPLKVITK